jgi:transcriptional regulator with XRE-family HTH domain
MIGKKIKELREIKKITQEELAKYLGVAPQTVYKYEKEINEPDLKTTSKIAEYFNVTTDYLLGRTDIPDMLNEPIQIAASMKDGLDISDMDDDEKKFINDFVEMVRKKKGDK